jgi:hypothetical protein
MDAWVGVVGVAGCFGGSRALFRGGAGERGAARPSSRPPLQRPTPRSTKEKSAAAGAEPCSGGKERRGNRALGEKRGAPGGRCEQKKREKEPDPPGGRRRDVKTKTKRECVKPHWKMASAFFFVFLSVVRRWVWGRRRADIFQMKEGRG